MYTSQHWLGVGDHEGNALTVAAKVSDGTIPTLTPQAVDLAASPAESRTKGKIRRPSRPISSYNGRPAARSVQARGRSQGTR